MRVIKSSHTGKKVAFLDIPATQLQQFIEQLKQDSIYQGIQGSENKKDFLFAKLQESVMESVASVGDNIQLSGNKIQIVLDPKLGITYNIPLDDLVGPLAEWADKANI